MPFTKGKIKLGAYVELGGLSESAGLSLRRRQLGRAERIVHQFYSWKDPLPTSLSYLSSASTLMLSWRAPAYTEVNDGSADKLIAAAARRMVTRGRPTLLRWAWDMNRDFYQWGGAANNKDTAGYVKAWRRVHRIFGEEGADNVSWVWSPNASSVPSDQWNRYANYYPGDEYVDWAGVSGYGQTQSPAEIFDAFYDAYAPRKPIMITEVSAVDRGGLTKPEWITSFREWVKARPAVGAVVWFDTDTHPGSKEKWRIDSTAASLSAYRAMSDDPSFSG
ncbi:MAG TPA: glycosyl hydrolase [Actinoplanes sp.]